MKLQVGEFYLSAGGEIVKIESCVAFCTIFMDTSDNEYSINGKCIGDMREFDLIAHIPKELHRYICIITEQYHTNKQVKYNIDKYKTHIKD